MATNTYAVDATMSGQILPLRGDMEPTLNFIPTEKFSYEFSVDEPGTYVVRSSAANIRGFDGVKRSSLTITGGVGIYVRIVWDKRAKCWKPIRSNMVSKGGFTPEVELHQDSAGNVTPDASLGNNFRVLVGMNGTVKDPQGYAPGEQIKIALRQANNGPFDMDWGQAYEHVDGVKPQMSTEPGGLKLVTAYCTGSLGEDFGESWPTLCEPRGSQLGFVAPDPQ